MFDHARVTEVWIKFSWTDRAMTMFRYWFCQPTVTSTYNTLCAVPVFEDKQDEEQWCLENYESTNCTAIRDDAQDRTKQVLLLGYTCNGIWVLLTVLVGVLVMDTILNIVSRPLFLKSRESNVPLWLSLPVTGTTIVGLGLTFSPVSILNIESDVKGRWLGPMYLVAAACFALAAVLSWLAARMSIFNAGQKRWKSFVILCLLSVSLILVIALVTIFVGSIVFSSYLTDITLKDSARGNFACAVDRTGTCTRCDEAFNKCPEWTNEDVVKVLRSQAKSSATLAGIFLLYTSGIIRFAAQWWRINQSYQIGYV